MVHPQPPFTFPLTSSGVLLTTDAQKAECLVTHIRTTLDSLDPVPTPVLPSSSHSSHEISTAITPQELTSTLLSLSAKKATGPDDVQNEFLRCLPDALLQLLQPFVLHWEHLSPPQYHALHSLLLWHGGEPLHGPLPYQANTPFVDRALSLFAILQVTPPPFLILEKTSPLGPWYPLSSSVSLSLHTSTQWSKAGCPVQGRTLFISFLHTQYHTHFHIYTDGSCLTNPPSIGAAIYIPSRSLATAWQLLATASIITAELFAIKEGLQFAKC
ncbi:hypothetical protein E2C01_068400 [Portunus trituberculatus]|uniref:RNase H type-1 domain-containing protein n=1 Tax=Portunus trituberculatus TaxID=210409 RepID=A0A5B7HW31_PORTR|nr:hypothetical protein [Portunus trituberculatus]